MFQENAGEGIGFIIFQAKMKGRLAFTTMDPTVPLAVVVFIPYPGIETATALWRDDMVGSPSIPFLEAVQVPLADI